MGAYRVTGTVSTNQRKYEVRNLVVKAADTAEASEYALRRTLEALRVKGIRGARWSTGPVVKSLF